MVKPGKRILYQDQPIKVRVGRDDEMQVFYIHENVLKASRFFKAMLRGTWKESRDRLIKLPEDDPESFQTYAHWLYTLTTPGSVLSNRQKRACPDFYIDRYFAETLQDSEYEELACLYVLGEKYLDSRFQNAVSDAFVQRFNIKEEFPNMAVIKHLYEWTNKRSPIRKLLSDMEIQQEIPLFLETHHKNGMIDLGHRPKLNPTMTPEVHEFFRDDIKMDEDWSWEFYNDWVDAGLRRKAIEKKEGTVVMLSYNFNIHNVEYHIMPEGRSY